MAETPKTDPKKPQPDPKAKPTTTDPAPPKPAGGGYPPMK